MVQRRSKVARFFLSISADPKTLSCFLLSL